jgi:hypothetical protein
MKAFNKEVVYVKLNKNTVGLTLGGLVALMHLVWSLTVMFGWAESWLSFVFGLHFLDNPFVLKDFSVGIALTLIIITGIIGYIMGWIFATIWNTLHKEQ